jgi:hypothetical protein
LRTYSNDDAIPDQFSEQDVIDLYNLRSKEKIRYPDQIAEADGVLILREVDIVKARVGSNMNGDKLLVRNAGVS